MKANLPACPPPAEAPILPDLLPLGEFYAARGARLPAINAVAPAEVPEPARSLLVHESDMTSTLEHFYRDKLRVLVLGHRRAANQYFREVALALAGDGRRVEYGAIKISLDLFPEEARREILREEQPLGRILAVLGVSFASRPAGYLRVIPDEFIARALNLKNPPPLFGRRNTLVDPWERSLAEIVEILPPPLI